MTEIPSNFLDKSLLLDWTRSMFRKYPGTNMESNIRWFGHDFSCSAGGHLFRYQLLECQPSFCHRFQDMKLSEDIMKQWASKGRSFEGWYVQEEEGHGQKVWSCRRSSRLETWHDWSTSYHHQSEKKHGKFDEISTTFFRPFPANWSRIQVDSFWDAKTRPSDTESCFLISWYLYSLLCWSCRQQICLKRLRITEDMKLWVWSFDTIHLSFGSKHPIWKRVLIPPFVVSHAGKRDTRLWPVSLRFVLCSFHLESFGLHIAAVIFRSRYKNSFASPSLSLGTRAMNLLQLRRWWCNGSWDMVAFRCYYRLVELPIICNGHQFNDCDLIMRIVILLSLLLYDMIVYILWYGSLIVSSMFIISIIGHLDIIALAPL